MSGMIELGRGWLDLVMTMRGGQLVKYRNRYGMTLLNPTLTAWDEVLVGYKFSWVLSCLHIV